MSSDNETVLEHGAPNVDVPEVAEELADPLGLGTASDPIAVEERAHHLELGAQVADGLAGLMYRLWIVGRADHRIGCHEPRGLGR